MERVLNRIALVMDGSRRHYDVAEALERQGCLDRMFADWYALPGSMQHYAANFLRFLGVTVGKRMSERYSPHISIDRIKSNPWLALESQFIKRKYRVPEEFWKWSSKKTADWVVHEGLGPANGLYGYIRNIDPGLCRLARSQGLHVVGEQMIAPAGIERREYEAQQAKWPGWEQRSSTSSFNLVTEIEEATWENVDRIVAPSQYVIDGLTKQGVDSTRIELVPYPADFDSHSFVDRSLRKKQMTVGFVGHINLRKNAPVFLEIAKRMHSREIKFVMVGKNQLNEGLIERYSDCVQFTGAIPRSEVATMLSSFDVFFFPSTCEGSAGVVLEAMATGLPVLTTPNSGTSVTEGVDGFLCASDNVDGFVERIEQFSRDRNLRLELGRVAASNVRELTLDRYGEGIVGAFNKCQSAFDDPTLFVSN